MGGNEFGFEARICSGPFRWADHQQLVRRVRQSCAHACGAKYELREEDCISFGDTADSFGMFCIIPCCDQHACAGACAADSQTISPVDDHFDSAADRALDDRNHGPVLAACIAWGIFARHSSPDGTRHNDLLFMSPVYYPISALPHQLQPWLHVNPLTF